ncbi:hypothetical protein D1872_335740 [compost metagenome]
MPLFGEFDRIADQIRQHLLETQWVQMHIDGQIWWVEDDLQGEVFLPGETVEDPGD